MPTHEGHNVVRTPELPENTDPITPDDCFIIWSAAADKTRRETIGKLLQFIGTGGGGSGVPGNMATKGWHIFDVSPDQAGGNTILLPQFAGKNFTLFIDLRPLKDEQYTVLNAGGFTVDIPDWKFQGGEQIALNFAEPIAPGTPGSPGTAGGFITGITPAPVNTTLTSADVNRVIQIRGDDAAVTVTLPDVGAVPDNSFLILETSIGNTRQSTITTQGGQNIYLENKSKQTIYMGQGESLWLYRGEDGWYECNNFSKIYADLARPFAAYEIGMNEVLCDGRIVDRADYPRLWEKVQALGAGLIPESQYNIFLHRGCFTNGNGSTTFRLPNLVGQFLRGLKSGDDRTYNNAGGWQNHQLAAHTHPYDIPTDGMPGGGNRMSVVDTDNSDEGNKSYTTGSTGGTETRPENVGMYWVIKC